MRLLNWRQRSCGGCSTDVLGWAYTPTCIDLTRVARVGRRSYVLLLKIMFFITKVGHFTLEYQRSCFTSILFLLDSKLLPCVKSVVVCKNIVDLNFPGEFTGLLFSYGCNSVMIRLFWRDMPSLACLGCDYSRGVW